MFAKLITDIGGICDLISDKVAGFFIPTHSFNTIHLLKISYSHF